MADRILPVVHQPPLPRERLILAEAPEAEALEMDVVIVGAGPAGLACAIELARLAKKDGESGGTLGELHPLVAREFGVEEQVSLFEIDLAELETPDPTPLSSPIRLLRGAVERR